MENICPVCEYSADDNCTCEYSLQSRSEEYLERQNKTNQDNQPISLLTKRQKTLTEKDCKIIDPGFDKIANETQINKFSKKINEKNDNFNQILIFFWKGTFLT